MDNPAEAEAYAEEAPFLWLQRAAAVDAPNYTLRQLAELDERLEAHVDGLRVAGDAGWQAAEEAANAGGAEDLFPASVLALEAKDGRFGAILDRVAGAPAAGGGLVSALGWVPARQAGAAVQALLRDADPARRRLGIAACGVHRLDPGARLEEALAAPAGALRARALRTAGELGAQAALPRVLRCLADRNRAARAWSAWSGVLLGDRGAALAALARIATEPGEWQAAAMRLALIVLGPAEGHELLQRLPASPEVGRHRVIGAGLIGAPHYVSWLLDHMEDPMLARVAGEAFALITGIDVNAALLEVPPPEDFEDGPTDDPDDEDVTVPEDLALPWLDAAKARAWWRENEPRLAAHPRLFMGAPPSLVHCATVLATGFQRQRRLAALHARALAPGVPLFNVSAPALRQIEALAP